MLAEQDLRARMRKLVAEIREIDPSLVEPTSRLREDLGMDSLGSLELLSSISEQLDVHIDIEDAMGLVTFEDACSFVERCVTDKHAAK
jgi:acyl carrier protein